MFFSTLIKTVIFTQVIAFLGIYNSSQNTRLVVNEGQVAGDRVIIEKPTRLINKSLGLEITSKSALAVDNRTGKVLFEKNPTQVVPIASISKLASILIFLDHQPDWNKEMTVLKQEEVEGGRLYVSSGELVSVEQLFYTALVGSANNATLALARSVDPDQKSFVAKMNKKMKSLGLLNSSFEEPTGLSEHNVSTAKDVVRLLNYALEYEAVEKALRLKVYEFNSLSGIKHRINSTDKLLDSYLDVVGGKTGFTDEAGNCLVVKIKGNQDQEITIAVLGAETADLRFHEAKSIAQWCFDNWEW